jgi:hypothetical protein
MQFIGQVALEGESLRFYCYHLILPPLYMICLSSSCFLAADQEF